MNEKTKILFLYNHTDFTTFYRSSYKTVIEFLNTLLRYTKLKMEAKLPALSYPSRLLPKNCQKS